MLIERLAGAVEGLLPASLQSATQEERRLASLVLYALVIAELAVLASAAFLWRMGLDETAQNVLFALAAQTSIAALLYLNVSPRLCGHLLIIVFVLEMIWDYGPDGGYGVMGAALVPTGGDRNSWWSRGAFLDCYCRVLVYWRVAVS